MPDHTDEPDWWGDLDVVPADRVVHMFKPGTPEHQVMLQKQADERAAREADELAAATRFELRRLRARKAAELQYSDQVHLETAHTADDLSSSWAALDLRKILDGSYEAEEPELMPRTDAVHLLYRGRVHTFQGESESGKSMVAQAVAAQLLRVGGRIAYLDFESDASVVVGRILQMGCAPDAVENGLLYMRPGVRPGATRRDREAWENLLACQLDLVVIDGVTEAASVFGVVSKDNDEITAWNREFARPLAQRTGAAVIQVDHVTKDADSRGRFAIGAQAKMSALDGASYVVEVKEPLGRGLRGVIAMRIAKDRPGAIRPHCGPFRASDRTQEACRVIVDSTAEGTIAIVVEPPSTGAVEADGRPAEFRPTALMERVSEYLEMRSGPQSENQITTSVSGRTTMVRKAIACLVEEGFVARIPGPRNASLHQLTAVYRQVDDSRSDKYLPPGTGM